MESNNVETPKTDTGKLKVWIKRAGIWGFLFFLAKGLVWIALAVFAGKKIFD